MVWSLVSWFLPSILLHTLQWMWGQSNRKFETVTTTVEFRTFEEIWRDQETRLMYPQLAGSWIKMISFFFSIAYWSDFTKVSTFRQFFVSIATTTEHLEIRYPFRVYQAYLVMKSCIFETKGTVLLSGQSNCLVFGLIKSHDMSWFTVLRPVCSVKTTHNLISSRKLISG